MPIVFNPDVTEPTVLLYVCVRSQKVDSMGAKLGQ